MVRDPAEAGSRVVPMDTLAEDLYLLACDEATGRPRIPATYLDLGLGGALLLDLALRGRMALVDGHVTVVDRTPVGDALLDDALATVAAAGKAHGPEHWVDALARGTRSAVQRRLVAAGVLAADDHRLLGVLPVHHTHQVDDRIEHPLLDRLRDAVVLGRTPSPHTAAVVSLVLAVGLDRHLFPRADRRAVRHRMEEVAAGEWVGAAVRHTVGAIEAALGIGVVAEP
jgi:Golgi phosphoprotein 3 (GPP34)